jgi:hypothetical protein
MVAEVKTIKFFEGLPVVAPDQTQPLVIGTGVNANHAVTKLQSETFAQSVANTAQANAIASSNGYTNTSISNLIGTAPVLLDTLGELSDALGDDPNFSTTILTALGNRLRVDTNAQGLTAPQKTNAKTNIDLENVDNTSDSTKNSASVTLTNKVIDKLVSQEQVDAVSTGSNAILPTPTKTLFKLTNASLVSVDEVPAVASMILVIQNKTGASITVNNNLGTVGNRILTGTGANLLLANDACLFLIYSPSTAIWQVVGGSGSGGASASGGVTLDWSKNSDNASLTEFIDGIAFESFDNQSTHEIYSIVTVPSAYILGSPIKLKRGQFFNISITGKVFFKTETTLINAGLILGTYPNKHNSTNAEVTVNGVSNTINDIGDIDLTGATGLINGVAVTAGMKLLIKLYRANVSESVSASNDARLLINNFEITFS